LFSLQASAQQIRIDARNREKQISDSLYRDAYKKFNSPKDNKKGSYRYYVEQYSKTQNAKVLDSAKVILGNT